jgi:hypothetical protein
MNTMGIFNKLTNFLNLQPPSSTGTDQQSDFQVVKEGGTDQDVIDTMLKNGADLSQPREMVFCVYASHSNAQTVCDAIGALGWECAAYASGDANPKPGEELFIEIKRTDYILAPQQFFADKAQITAIAAQYGASYDGWYAST